MPKHLRTEPGFAREDIQAQSLNIKTIVTLRWIAVAGQLAAIGIVSYILEFPLPLGYCLAAIAMSAWLNVYISVAYPARTRIGSAFATSMLVYDVLQLSLLLHLTGGIENPFIMLLLAPVTVSAATLPLRNTIFLGIISMGIAALLIKNHWPLPWYENLPFAQPLLFKVGMFCALAASMVFIALYAWRLADETRRMFAAKAAAELVLAREQKLHALDGLAAAAAHELGTPLSTIYLVTKELANDKSLADQHVEDVLLLRDQAERCRVILRKLTKKSNAHDDPMHASLSVRELIDEAATPYVSLGKKISITARSVETHDGKRLREPVGVRRPGVVYGLGNLIENAVSFAKSEVEISALWSEDDVTVEISDDGPGFSHDVLDSLGNPYISTRSSATARTSSDQGGLGLGFFIAKTLLERSGANFDFANKMAPRSGAIVRISWSRDAFTKRERD